MHGLFSTIWFAVLLVAFFGVTIFIHELGHYLVARLCGLVVETFSIGFGPAIWKREHHGITYKIGIFPVGGYVALPQLDPSGMSQIQGGSGGGSHAAALPRIPPWKKILVTLAGVTGNILLATVIAWCIALSPSAVTSEGNTTIGYVSTNSPAYAAGLRVGDQIQAVGGKAVASWTDFLVECHLAAGGMTNIDLRVLSGKQVRMVTVPLVVLHDESVELGTVVGIGRASYCVIKEVVAGMPAEQCGLQTNDIVREVDGTVVMGTEHFISIISKRGGHPTTLVIDRAGKLLHVAVTPTFNAETQRAIIGVKVSPGDAGVPPWMEYKKPGAQLMGDASGIVRVLRALVSTRRGESRQARESLGGPILILVVLWSSIKTSFFSSLGFLRFLNVNLAVLNLLPIPVLDGGHICFALLELVRRKPLNARFVNALVNVFAILLISLIVLISLRDVDRFTPVGHLVRGVFGGEKTAATTNAATQSLTPETNAPPAVPR